MGEAGRTLQRITPAFADTDIAVYRIGGVNSVAPQWKRIAVILAHLAWAAMLLGAATALTVGRLRRAGQSF